MQIDSVGRTSPAITVATPKGLDAWRAGQILTAIVVATQPQDNNVTLRINNAVIQARSQLSLTPGQQLNVQVTVSGSQTVLKIVDDTPQSVAPLTQALRENLPRQNAFPPLLANLAWLASPAGKNALSQNIAQLAAQVFNSLPRPDDIATADGLKNALYNSGTFLESKLAAPATAQDKTLLSVDFKAGLLRLVDKLQTEAGGQSQHVGSGAQTSASAPPPLRGAPLQAQAAMPPSLAEETSTGRMSAELTHQAEGALARLQLNQLAALPTTGQTTPLWTLELPVRRDEHTEILHLRIERDQSSHTSSATSKDTWTVTLAMDTGNLGPLHARITLADQQVSAALWAEKDSTATLLDQHINELRQDLDHAGLKTGAIRCQQGAAPQTTMARQTTLVDLKA
ncbi:MAG: flagellar hook-length control protein FliK [Gammaproteobacteria bacterium]|nr:flagellar hook-length control protein FliK [Gammaproteobacteria bacterium]